MTEKLDDDGVKIKLCNYTFFSAQPITSLLLLAGTTCGSLKRRFVFSNDIFDMFADDVFIAGLIEFSSSVESCSCIDTRVGGRSFGENTLDFVLP